MAMASKHDSTERDQKRLAYEREVAPKIAKALDMSEADAATLLRRHSQGEHLGQLSFDYQIPATDLATALLAHGFPLRRPTAIIK